jgi:hypothetical protein
VHHIDQVALVEEGTAAGSDARLRRYAIEDFNAPAFDPPGLHLALLHDVVAPDLEYVTQAVAQRHRRLGHGQRFLLPQFDAALRIHASPCSTVARQIDVDQCGTGIGVQRGRDHAHFSLHLAALRQFHRGFLARADTRQLRGRDLGTPFQPSLAHQLEHLRASTHYRPYRRRS